MSAPLFSLASEALKPEDLIQAVGASICTAPLAIGAIASFLGLVRGENLGRRVIRLEYESYEPLAIKAFERIAMEAREHWPKSQLALHHRLGRLQVGEISVAIAVSSAHRAESFAVCRYAIERVKQIAPIWKHEFFEGGHVWIEGAIANPDDDVAREEAYRLACG
jgi:molybdopterin synthase catalytic subunit